MDERDVGRALGAMAEAPPGDPAAVLLWSTGRGELDGRPRRTSWAWQAALPG
jgi:hypothetical protein